MKKVTVLASALALAFFVSTVAVAQEPKKETKKEEHKEHKEHKKEEKKEEKK